LAIFPFISFNRNLNSSGIMGPTEI
jgi:hypothetical protein